MNSHSQTHWRKNRTLHLYVFQKTFWKDTQQSASLWQWLNVCVCIGSGHKTQPALLLHCTWLHCTFVFYDIKDQPWSPKDLWSLRHWWTLCLLMINMLWWFLKILKIHPYDRPYDSCLWSSLWFLLKIIRRLIVHGAWPDHRVFSQAWLSGHR